MENQGYSQWEREAFSVRERSLCWDVAFFSAVDDLGLDTNKNSSMGVLFWVVKYGKKLPWEVIRRSFLKIFKEKGIL